ncbi:MAG: histidine phosphatase family protein [Rhodospirillales bacterium]|nr:histidine phosphatase family protein [Rhodospirillales bacterium]
MPIYLIRHGQSEFNAAHAEAPHIDPMLFDAPLTALGIEQAKALRQQVAGHRIEHVIASPLIRAIQTAMHIFGDDHPITINPDMRENLLSSCDVGSHPNDLKKRFGHLDFDHLPAQWWHGDPEREDRIQVEPEAVFRARASAVRAYLDQWEGPTLAVVGHGTFFTELAGYHMQNCEIHQYRA